MSAVLSFPARQKFVPADGWVPWYGGHCPVSRTQLVEVRLRNGRESPALWPAEIVWKHGMLGIRSDDVIAYRIVPKPEAA
jgi:hypothetical protein